MKYKICDICTFSKGASVPRARMYDCGTRKYLHYGDLYSGHEIYIDIKNPSKPIPYISNSENIKDSQLVSNGDIVYILTSETVEDLGKSLIVTNANNDDVIVSGTETTILRVDNKDILFPKYLNYMLQTIAFKKTLQQYVTGMKVFRVHPRDIGKICIDIPSLENQKKIVNILDSIYNKVSLNNKLNDYLAEYSNILFSGLYEHSDDLFDPSSKYENVSLEEVANFSNGYSFKSKEFSKEKKDGYLDVFKQGHISPGGGFRADGTKSWINNAFIKSKPQFLLKQGDVLMAMTDMKDNVVILGNTAYMPFDNKFVLNQRVGLLRSIDPEFVSQEYLYLLTNNKYFNSEIRKLANRGVQVNLSANSIRNIQFNLPKEEDLLKLNTATKPIFEIICSNIRQNIKLIQIRDTLLPKLMSGEIDVSSVKLSS